MDITESYLNQQYETFATEQMRLMQSLKSSDDEEAQKKVQKLLTMINQLMLQILRYRNLQKQR